MTNTKFAIAHIEAAKTHLDGVNVSVIKDPEAAAALAILSAIANALVAQSYATLVTAQAVNGTVAQ